MRPRLARLLVGALCVLLVAAAPAAAEVDEIDEIEFVRQDVWFHAASTPLGNLDAYEGNYLAWSEEEPTASAPLGAGGVYVGNNYSSFTELLIGGERHHNTISFEGTFTGHLDTWALDLYFYLPMSPVLDCGMALAFELWVDDEDLIWQDYLDAVEVNAEPAGDGLYRARFALTNLYEAMTRFGVETGPDVTHEIFLNAANFYACQEAVWVYDSAEAPAGGVFNADDLLGYTEVDVLNPPPPPF